MAFFEKMMLTRKRKRKPPPVGDLVYCRLEKQSFLPFPKYSMYYTHTHTHTFYSVFLKGKQESGEVITYQ